MGSPSKSAEISDKDTVLVHTHKFGHDTGRYGILNVNKVTKTQIHVYDHNTGKIIKFNTHTKRGIGDDSNFMIKKIISEAISQTVGPDFKGYLRTDDLQIGDRIRSSDPASYGAYGTVRDVHPHGCSVQLDKAELPTFISHYNVRKLEENMNTLDEAYVWYDISKWKNADDSKFKPLDNAGPSVIAHAATHKEFQHIPDHYVGIPTDRSDLIKHMDRHARLADPDVLSAKRQSNPNYGHYKITVGGKLTGNEGGDIRKAYATTSRMSSIGIPHSNEDHYGDTVSMTVENTRTGDKTHHHVYQAGIGKAVHGEAELRSISIRPVGKIEDTSSKHNSIIKDYIEGKPFKMSESTDIVGTIVESILSKIGKK